MATAGGGVVTVRPRRPARGHGAVARELQRMPPGSTVRLHFGEIFVRYVRRWMVAGVIGDPLTSTALAKLNGGTMPSVLAPAWTVAEVAP